jgi:hypothetical protein
VLAWSAVEPAVETCWLAGQLLQPLLGWLLLLLLLLSLPLLLPPPLPLLGRLLL